MLTYARLSLSGGRLGSQKFNPCVALVTPVWSEPSSSPEQAFSRLCGATCETTWARKDQGMSDSNTTHEPDRLLNFREVALILGLSDWSVRQMAQRGNLPATRVGFGRGVWRVRKSDLDVYINSRATVKAKKE